MARKRERGNADGDVWPRRNREGKIIGYRASYWVDTPSGPKRRYVSGKNKSETRPALNPAQVRALYRARLDEGLSPRTVQYVHVTLHKALDQAQSDGLVARNRRFARLHRSRLAPSWQPRTATDSRHYSFWPCTAASGRVSSWA